MLLPGYRMAVRNCPWEVDFWEGLARGMERNKSSYGEVAGRWYPWDVIMSGVGVVVGVVAAVRGR